MLWRVLELCLTVIFLTLTLKEIVLPLIKDEPLFPLVRRTIREQQKEGR